MKYLKYSGYLITLLAIYYIFEVIVDSGIAAFPTTITILRYSLYVTLLSLIYGLIYIISTFGFKIILEFLIDRQIALTDSIKINVTTNIYKYLPGNLFHFVGRNILFKEIGLSHSNTALASIVETGLFFLSTIILISILVFNDFLILLKVSTVQIKPLVAVLLTIALIILGFWLNKNGKFKIFLTKKFLVVIIKVFFIYSAVIIFIGILFIILFKLLVINVEYDTSYFLMIPYFILSWFAGQIIPGAPAGIGIRESVLLITLGPTFGEANILLVAFSHRLVSVIGDIIAFLFGIPLKINRTEKK